MRKIVLIVFGFFVLSNVAVSISAELSAGPLQIKNYEGITYVSGGIGLDEREAMTSVAGNFNLKMIFAIKEGNYLADIGVVVRDAQGKTILDAVSDGPWFYAKLPAGKYTVIATMLKKANTENVQIKPAGHAVLHFYWTE